QKSILSTPTHHGQFARQKLSPIKSTDAGLPTICLSLRWWNFSNNILFQRGLLVRRLPSCFIFWAKVSLAGFSQEQTYGSQLRNLSQSCCDSLRTHINFHRYSPVNVRYQLNPAYFPAAVSLR